MSSVERQQGRAKRGAMQSQSLGMLASLLFMVVGVGPWVQAQEATAQPMVPRQGIDAPSSVQAPPGTWDSAALVHELLRLDAEAALAAEQGRVLAAQAAQPVSVRPLERGNVYPGGIYPGLPSEPASIQVHAIYGIGSRLHAELSVGVQHYVYRAGRRLPLGMSFSPDEDIPTLERISGACVALNRRGRAEHHCVNRSTTIVQALP